MLKQLSQFLEKPKTRPVRSILFSHKPSEKDSSKDTFSSLFNTNLIIKHTIKITDYFDAKYWLKKKPNKYIDDQKLALHSKNKILP